MNAVAFSPDGTLLATADTAGYVRLWNPATGQAVGAPFLAVTNGGVVAVAFSPDGKLLATADGDGTARLWNPATRQAVGAPMRAVPGPEGGCGCVQRGVQPGRHAAGHRRQRRVPAAVGPSHPGMPSALPSWLPPRAG